MSKKALTVWVFCGFILAGCATTGSGGRSSQADIDTLNQRVAALQGQLSEKDAEIAKMQNQMREDTVAMQQVESDKRALAEKLDAATAELNSSKKSSRSSSSDLK